MIYAISDTILFNVFSLKRIDKDNEFEFLEMDIGEITLSNVNKKEQSRIRRLLLKKCSSPRIRPNKPDLYLCQNNVAWVYIPMIDGTYDYVEEWDEWAEFIKENKFKEGLDYVCFAPDLDDLESGNKYLKEYNCKWIKMAGRNHKVVKLEVIPRYLFRGHLMLSSNSNQA